MFHLTPSSTLIKYVPLSKVLSYTDRISFCALDNGLTVQNILSYETNLLFLWNYVCAIKFTGLVVLKFVFPRQELF